MYTGPWVLMQQKAGFDHWPVIVLTAAKENPFNTWDFYLVGVVLALIEGWSLKVNS